VAPTISSPLGAYFHEATAALPQVLAVADRMQGSGQRSRHLTVTRMAVAHSWALCRGDYLRAEDLAHQIVAAAGPVKSLNMCIRHTLAPPPSPPPSPLAAIKASLVHIPPRSRPLPMLHSVAQINYSA